MAKKWRPTDKQATALQRSERELLLGGARGGGKTELGFAWLADVAYVRNPDFRALVLRHDYEDLCDWLFRAQRFFGEAVKITGNPAKIAFPAGGEIRCGYWKDKNTVRRYIGHEYWKILVEELTWTVPTEEEYQLLLGSLRSPEGAPRAQLMATTNPGGPGHAWVKKYFVDKAQNKSYLDGHGGSRIYIPFGAKDNEHVSAEYITYLESLREPLRSAWLLGAWNAFEGQFFSYYGARERPFELPHDARIYGSLDVGVGHPTSFGLWYQDLKGYIHRLFTYKNKLDTHKAHAQEIFDRIQAFRWTHHRFPETVWTSPDAWTKQRMREDLVVSIIDQYLEVFKDTRVNFAKANNDRQGGCATMLEAFDESKGTPIASYWEPYNRTYEEDMMAMVTDPNNPETYAKVDGDDTPDEVRYGLTGILSWMSYDYASKGNPGKFIPLSTDDVFRSQGYHQIVGETSIAA